MKKMKVAVLGTQASGKGTQAHIISALMGAAAVSVGDLLRDLQNEDSARGREAKLEMSKGSFVADEIIMPLLKEWTAKHPDAWVVDGFPRSVEQAKKCAAFFKPDAVLYLEVPDAESKRRISYRRICGKCKTNYNLVSQMPRNPQGLCDACGGTLIARADDTPELVEQRLKNYHEVTEPLKRWFAKRRKLVLIDASGDIREVAYDVQRSLEGFVKAKLRRRRPMTGLLITLAALPAFAAGPILIDWILNS